MVGIFIKCEIKIVRVLLSAKQNFVSMEEQNDAAQERVFVVHFRGLHFYNEMFDEEARQRLLTSSQVGKTMYSLED